MSGRGAKTVQKKRQTKSGRSGLVMPVSRFIRALRKGNYAKRLSVASGVYTAAVVEYLVAEVLELAGKASTDNKKKRISPRHIQLAIRNDEELNRFCEGVVIAQGGVIPHLHPALLKPHSQWKVADTNINLTTEAKPEKEKSEKSKSKSPKKKSKKAVAQEDEE
ncbi:histone H2A-beta, sperm-like [Paramacrobiotus metropolitanus]|uniref:histone H2A-beta, sperm-like n=1 Tax=Paramacrobiotus metropolitanus TaxID=2943436 RepID=UPI0024456F34|nr:histone H2A-beta, sperm-like [Paramacrobiotus metropolitanus]